MNLSCVMEHYPGLTLVTSMMHNIAVLPWLMWCLRDVNASQEGKKIDLNFMHISLKSEMEC